jgi:molybdate transport system substrate-binding protein
MKRLLPLLVLLLASALRANEIVVSAAASTRDALTAVARAYEARTHDRVLLNFGGSNEMVRQIRAGAPVDIFLAADERSMRQVSPRGRTLLTNRLAIVAARAIAPRDLSSLRRIAIANWRAGVPAGVYWQRYLGPRWHALEPKLIPSLDVRAALAAYDGGAVDAALVYATDAAMSKRAHATFVVRDGPPIAYPVAMIRATPAAARFLSYLFSADARRVFERYGF